MSVAMSPGSTKTWTMNSRGSKALPPGNCPSQTSAPIAPPIPGIDSAVE